MDISSFEKFLAERFKVDNKIGAHLFDKNHRSPAPCPLTIAAATDARFPACVGQLGTAVKITRDKTKVTVTSNIAVSFPASSTPAHQAAPPSHLKIFYYILHSICCFSAMQPRLQLSSA